MNNTKKLQINKLDFLILIALSTLIFVILELSHPFYFLYDDNQNAYIYYFVYAYKSILKGNFPFYCFNHFLGSPFFATGQTGTLNPLVYLACFISNTFFHCFTYTIDILAYIYSLIAALGMYLVIRSFSCKRFLAISGALVWAFNPYILFIGRCWIIIHMVFAVIPLVFLGTKYLHDNVNYKGIIVSIIPKLLFFYIGHPQFFIWGIIFDFLTVILFYIWAEDNKSNKKFFLYYIISFIPLTLLCLPLLGTMWKLMGLTASRSGSLEMWEFLEFFIPLEYFLQGLLNPFYNVADGDLNFTRKIELHISHFTYLFILAYIVGICIIFLNKNKIQRKKLVSLYAISLVSFFSSSSIVLLAIIYMIPILNRFRWPFKYFIWFIFFAIIISTYTINYFVEKYTITNKIKKILAPSVTTITVINLIVVCLFSSINHWGVMMNNSLNNKPDYLDDTFSNARYAVINKGNNFWDNETSEFYGFDIYIMTYDIALFYNYSNVFGYDVLTPSEDLNRLPDAEVVPYAGSIDPLNSNCFEELNYLGTDTFVVGTSWLMNSDPSISGILNTDDYKLVQTEDYWAIYKNNSAKPVVRTADDTPVDYELDTNSITVKTDDSFKGGDILLMYSYNPNFHAYENGHEIEVFEGEYHTMRISASAGANTINIKYKDSVFTWSCVIGILGSGACLAAIYMLDKRTRKNL